jgi:hypothetical protein
MGHLIRDFFFLKVTVLSFIGAPSLTRGRVCHVSVLAGGGGLFLPPPLQLHTT